MMVSGRLGIMAVVSVLLAGCAVGPDFHTPAAPKVKGYTPEPLAKKTAASAVQGGQAQQFVSGQDIPGQWWTLFHSEPLNRLVSEAITHNPDLQAAQASLRQARETVYAAQGVYVPSVDLKGTATRQKISFAQFGRPGSGGSQYTLYNASVNVSYSLDLFGGSRRQLESLRAQADYQQFQLQAAWLTLTANVVTAAIQEASLRDQVAATQDIVTAEQEQMSVLRKQYALGGVSQADVLAQQARLSQVEATLPPLKKQLALARNQLAALAGRFPSQASGAAFDLSALQLPQQLPLSLPSQLVRQRPDIRAAEAQLHSASAEVGVATANMLPQITLTGAYGSVGTNPGQLFGPGSMIWNMGAGLLQPIIRGGELMHQRRAAVAAFDQAAARYRSTVLTAFRNVADALRALQADADTLAAQAKALNAADASLKLARDQFNAGAISYLSLLNAQSTYQQARIAFVQAKAGRYADTAALFQALGGGWWNRTDVAEGKQ